MTRKVVGVATLLALALFALASLLPKRYRVAESLSHAIVFWNADEAFFFLTSNTTGRSANVVQERLEASSSSWGLASLYFSMLFVDHGFAKSERVVHLLRPPGSLRRLSLPEGSATYGSWSLHEGKLQADPPPFAAGANAGGFRWNGNEFEPVAPTARAAKATSDLTPDDAAAEQQEEDERDVSVVDKTARDVFRKAGWHYKTLFIWEPGKESTLPITLGASTFRLSMRTFERPAGSSARFDMTNFGPKSLELTGDGLGAEARTLWAQSGWKELSKQEYQALVTRHGSDAPASVTNLVWLWAVVALMLVRVGQPVFALFGVATLKRRLHRNMASSYSFPPVSPAQFPALDVKELERYTNELQALGFTQLLDFTPVADSPTHPPSFCRLLAHSRHRCFAEVIQIFPNGMKAFPLKINVNCHLSDGWSIGFTDRPPMALSALFRRAKAIGGCRTKFAPHELLDAMLTLRDRVCHELGLAPLEEATLPLYIAETQRSLLDMRAAFENRSLVAGLSLAGVRKLRSLKPGGDYTWLGDYPELARRRGHAVPIQPL